MILRESAGLTGRTRRRTRTSEPVGVGLGRDAMTRGLPYSATWAAMKVEDMMGEVVVEVEVEVEGSTRRKKEERR